MVVVAGAPGGSAGGLNEGLELSGGAEPAGAVPAVPVDASDAGLGEGAVGGGADPAPPPPPAAAAPPASRAVHGLFSPLALPAKPHFPNLTALAVDVHESLTSAVRDAVVKAASVSPSLCPNSTTRAVVKCAKSSCDAKPCGTSQVCVPACGSCSEHK
jgi:hypothetical protein